MTRRLPLRTSLVLPLALLVVAVLSTPGRAQFGEIPPADQLVQITASPVRATAGGTAEAAITLRVLDTWHINANPAANENMIATVVSLSGAPGLTPRAIAYPAPKIAKLAFDEEPLLVWDGETTIRIPIAVAPNAPNGKHALHGEVMFQACNDQVCLAPTQVRFAVTVEVTGGAVVSAITPAPADTQASASPPVDPALPSAGFVTAPPEGPAIFSNPLAEKFAAGGLGSFLAIFLIGLALNLTPCVYPMLGVTVSIFGARRAAPPARVFAMAVLYVLGMALMYSVLGLVAAFTGGLFGSFLQSPFVLIGIGALMIALSLSMFGLYELQPPAPLLERLGGSDTTSAAGVFLSGLVVGIFAAPCIGPPVVALLAVVGAKGDPWFGFTSFFTLAMGLGFPYLLLGTFSNLLQTMPRSGEWMIWVKKVFGVVLVGVGLFYALLALAPRHATTVIPVTLAVGGLYLGFFERSAANRRGFQWLKHATGALGIVFGVLIFIGQSRQGIAFEAGTTAAVEAAIASGRPVMMDFSADWCVSCHELEDATFTDRRVIEVARDFRTFRVDLTRFNSPDAERWRQRFEIRGLPTIVFLDARGDEVREARVEGFLPPERFIERMQLATARAQALAE